MAQMTIRPGACGTRRGKATPNLSVTFSTSAQTPLLQALRRTLVLARPELRLIDSRALSTDELPP